MNVNLYNTTDYENKSNWTLGENKPNSNPIKANLLAVSKIPKMNITSATTVNYINELRTTNYELIMKNKAKTNPISSKAQMSANAFSQKDYDKEQRTINNERYSKQTQTNPIGEDRYKTKDPRHKTKDTNLESEVWSLEAGRKAGRLEKSIFLHGQ